MKAAVIGCGRMGAFTSQSMIDTAPPCWFPLAHAEAVIARPGLSLEALVDPSAEAREAAQGLYGNVPAYAAHSDMLAAHQPELVTIATRTVGRAQIIEDCLAAGVRALHIEKPLCSSAEELARLESAFADPEIFVTLGALRRYLWPYRFALKKAQDGSLGDMTEARIAMGPAPLYWAHPHSVDLALHAAGDIAVESVTARLISPEFEGTTLLNDPVIAHATIVFAGGFTAHITQAPGRDVHYSCERGEVSVINNGHSVRVAHTVGANPYPQHDPLDLPKSDAPGGTLAPVSQLAACLSGDAGAIAANAVNKRAVLANQRVLFAIVQSHLEGGRPVAPGDIRNDLTIRAQTSGKPA